MRSSLVHAAAASLVLLAGCASGSKLAEIQADMPRLKPDEGRIFFYRAASMSGSVSRPPVLLNGAAVGETIPGGFFFVDRPRGPVEVSILNEVETKFAFTLEPGQTRYVRISVRTGIAFPRVTPELVDNETGAREIQDSSYTGLPLK